MKSAWSVVVPFCAIRLLAPSPARADVAPAEPEACTVEGQQKVGETCVKCTVAYDAPDACQASYGTQGYKQRCKTKGASTWREIWCRTATDAAVAAVPSAASAGSVVPPASSTSAAPAPPARVAPEGGSAPAPSSVPASPKAGCGACALTGRRAAELAWPAELAWLPAVLAAVGVRARRRRARRGC